MRFKPTSNLDGCLDEPDVIRQQRLVALGEVLLGELPVRVCNVLRKGKVL